MIFLLKRRISGATFSKGRSLLHIGFLLQNRLSALKRLNNRHFKGPSNNTDYAKSYARGMCPFDCNEIHLVHEGFNPLSADDR